MWPLKNIETMLKSKFKRTRNPNLLFRKHDDVVYVSSMHTTII